MRTSLPQKTPLLILPALLLLGACATQEPTSGWTCDGKPDASTGIIKRAAFLPSVVPAADAPRGLTVAQNDSATTQAYMMRRAGLMEPLWFGALASDSAARATCPAQ